MHSFTKVFEGMGDWGGARWGVLGAAFPRSRGMRLSHHLKTSHGVNQDREDKRESCPVDFIGFLERLDIMCFQHGFTHAFPLDLLFVCACSIYRML